MNTSNTNKNNQPDLSQIENLINKINQATQKQQQPAAPKQSDVQSQGQHQPQPKPSPLWLQLEKILAEQSQLLGQQLSYAQNQNQALIQIDTDALTLAIDELTKLVAPMDELNQKREKLQTQLEQQLNLKPGANLSTILPFAPTALQPNLKQIQNQLLEQLNRLKQLNESNNVLTRQAMHFNQNILQLFTAGGPDTYRHSGDIRKSDPSTGLVNKTV